MEGAFRRIAVAAKNTDTREHDIADSDDYFQYHGGMVAMVRSLTGHSPAAYIGDSAVPDAVKTRTLAEETRRVFRSRVVNPRWIAAMQRHGYKGAFELAATVDYLFGYDATAGVVEDWMYEQLAASYVFDRRPTGRSWSRPTRGRCTASPSGSSKPPSAGCGPSPTRPRSTSSSRPSWPQKARSRAARQADRGPGVRSRGQPAALSGWISSSESPSRSFSTSRSYRAWRFIQNRSEVPK